MMDRNETIVHGFRKKYSNIRTRFELIALEQELIEFMQTENYDALSSTRQAEVEDLLAELLTKKEFFQAGCDPWKTILRSKHR